MVSLQTGQAVIKGRSDRLTVPKLSDQELLKKDFLPQTNEPSSTLSPTTTPIDTNPKNTNILNPSHHLIIHSNNSISKSSQSSFRIAILPITPKPRSARIMKPANQIGNRTVGHHTSLTMCSCSRHLPIQNPPWSFTPSSHTFKSLIERCEEQESKLNRLKESLHPHILSTRTAVSHLNCLASRATKTAELIEQQSKTFGRLAKEDIRRQIESDSIGHERDSSNMQSDLLGDDQLELARSKLSSLNHRLEHRIALQRHYETRFAQYLSKIRRLFLILLTIKILVDLKHRNQYVNQAYDFFLTKLINIQRLPNFIIKPKGQSTSPPTFQPRQPASASPMDQHQNEPVFSFLIHLLWLILLKVECFWANALTSLYVHTDAVFTTPCDFGFRNLHWELWRLLLMKHRERFQSLLSTPQLGSVCPDEKSSAPRGARRLAWIPHYPYLDGLILTM